MSSKSSRRGRTGREIAVATSLLSRAVMETLEERRMLSSSLQPLETITVPVVGSGGTTAPTITSTTVLQNGVTYWLKAYGTATKGGPGDGRTDAEYGNLTSGATHEDVDPGNGTDFGVDIDSTTTPNWGPYNSAHVYYTSLVGSGSTINAKYMDSLYTDNSGSLKVDIYPAGFTPPVVPPQGGCNPGGPAGPNNGGPTPTPPPDASSGPVRYFDGTVEMSTTDLQSMSQGRTWGQSRNWTNTLGYDQSGINGTGTVMSQQPSLVIGPNSATVAVVTGGSTAKFFDYDLSSDAYTEKFFALDTLQYSASNSEFTLTDSGGNQTRFYDYDPGLPSAQQGQFKSFTDAEGNMTAVTAHTTDGKISEVQSTTGTGGTAITESYLYSYVSGGTNDGLLSNVTLRRKVGTGSWATVRQVDYTYYDGVTNASFGNTGNLQTAVINDGSANTIDTKYYRYYVAGDSNGYVGGLKYVFGPESYERLDAAVANPLTTSNATAEPYADNYFQYDTSRRVTQEVVQNSGCSCTGNNGLGTFTFSYAASGNGAGFNTWAAKTTETLPDGNQNIVYANSYGEVMLSVYKDTTSGDMWGTYYRYDGAGRVILQANPAAVALPGSLSTLESNTDLMAYSAGGTSTYLNDSAGEINLTTYGTATSGSDVAGYQKYSMLERGDTAMTKSITSITYSTTTATVTATAHGYSNGDVIVIAGAAQSEYDGAFVISGVTANTFTYTMASAPAANASGTMLALKPILQSYNQYTSRSGGGVTIYPLASSTIYRNADQTGAETTSYSYTWQGSTTQMAGETTTLPTVTTAQNGPNSADTSTVVYDSFGRLTWSKDGGGFITYNAYDDATGGLLKSTTDVNTANTGDFANLPSGWTTPSGGGLHLITTYVVDDQGRTTKMTDPNGNITYTVYDDPNHEVRTYRGWNGATNQTTGPIEVTREDRPGSYSESLTFTYSAPTGIPVDANGVPTASELLTSGYTAIQTLSRGYSNNSGQVVSSDQYFDLSGVTYSTAANIGTLNTNYYRSSYWYDERGRQGKSVSPTGTITRTIYDGLGRMTSTWIGTDDMPTSDQNGDSVIDEDDFNAAIAASGTAPAGTDMVKVSENVYDNAGVGDGNLTQSTSFPNGSTSPRVSQSFYDWRDRMVASKSGVLLSSGVAYPAGETDGAHRPISYVILDNLGQATEQDMYDGDGLTITSTNGVPDQPSSTYRRAKTLTYYDEQGRVYDSETFSVDPSTGTSSANSLSTQTWYDHRGNTIKTYSPGGLYGKNQYDGAGRLTKTFATYAGGDTAWSDADDVTGDWVYSQSQTQYDANGNAIFSIGKDSFNDGSTGELGDATTNPKARVSYSATYYDAANRPVTSLDVGTNGGSSYTRPAAGSIPARSDTVLRSDTNYNDAGWAESMTDPKGLVSKSFYDAFGRTTKTIQNYVDGTPSADTDQTTLYTYDGAGHTLTMTADMPSGTNDQTTAYVYGVTTGGGSGITSNDLLATIKYPNKSTGAASTNASDQQAFTYDALGEQLTKTDQNGSVHTYSYDVLGRLSLDAVTTLGTGVDGAIRALGYTYNTQGLPYQLTSYSNSAGTTVVNQVQEAYNGLGQLTTEYQEHSGSVNTSTSAKVQYAYVEMASSANNSRMTSMTYPNTRVVNYGYGSADLNDVISRLARLYDAARDLETYDYLGLGTVIKRGHPENGVDLTMIKQGAEGTGDAGDQYTGLDRFGRVDDQRWINTATSTATDRFQYGYDRDSNPLYKNNLVSSVNSELYHADSGSSGDNASAYDGLNRLINFQRGTLSSSGNNGSGLDTVSTNQRSQGWTLDQLGNWSSSSTNGSSTSRTHNSQNEVTAVGSDNVSFDNNGNTTFFDDVRNGFTYDAWNRLAKATTWPSSFAIEIKGYAYDALGRRIIESPAGVTATDLYYSSQWQVLEEKQGSTVTAQNLWSPVFVDALVERDTIATQSDGSLDTGFDTDGKLTTSFGGNNDVLNRMALQSDGKLIAAGSAGTSGNLDFAIARYNTDGSLDTSFDTDGKQTLNFNGKDDAVNGIVIQSSGKIVVGGYASTSTGDQDFALARFTSAGALDTSFGTSGKTTTDFGTTADQGRCIAVQSDGKILVGGISGSDYAIARYSADGVLDTTFGGSGTGKKTIDFASGFDEGHFIAVQSDDKIVFGGVETASAGGVGSTTLRNFGIVRLNSDGTIDTGFGTSGKVTTDLSSNLDGAQGVVIQADGKIVVGGVGTNGSGSKDFFMVRYNTDGSLDTGFGSSGKVATSFTTSDDRVWTLILQPDGKIVAAGSSNTGTLDFAVARYNIDGSLDTTFDTDGKLTVSLSSLADEAYSVVQRPDGKIILGGYATVATGNQDWAIVQLGLPTGLSQRMYAQQDANFNTTALVNTTGTVVERVVYDAYGQATFLNADYSVKLVNASAYSNPYLSQGGRQDSVTGLVNFRHRDDNVVLGRWMQQDPERYVDGLNIYQLEQGRPTISLDPFGLASFSPAIPPEVGYPDPEDVLRRIYGNSFEINSFQDALAQYRGGGGYEAHLGEGLMNQLRRYQFYKDLLTRTIPQKLVYKLRDCPSGRVSVSADGIDRGEQTSFIGWLTVGGNYSVELNNSIGTINSISWTATGDIVPVPSTRFIGSGRGMDSSGAMTTECGCYVKVENVQVHFSLRDRYDFQGANNRAFRWITGTPYDITNEWNDSFAGDPSRMYIFSSRQRDWRSFLRNDPR